MSLTPEPFAWDPALDPQSLRVGYVASAFEAADAGETGAHHRPAGEELQRANQVNSAGVLDVMRADGFDLRPIELPPTDMNGLNLILFAEAAAAFDEITRAGRVDTMARQDDDAWPNIFRAARFIPAVEYINANRIRTQLMQDMARLMRDIDVFIVPSFGANALQITNFTGHPTVVVPNGFTDKRTPTSITFIGGLYQEAQTLALARAYQDATDWHRQYPAL